MPRAFEPYHELCMRCGCIMSLTSSPWVPISCVLAFSSLQVGLARCVLRLLWVFRRVRLVQALLSSPSSAGLVPFSVGLRFSFPLPFQGCPFWARFHVLVVALSLFFCVPLFASWLSNTFISLSSSPHFHFPFSSFSSHCRDLSCRNSLAAARRVCGPSKKM